MRKFLVNVDGTRNYVVDASSTITAKPAARAEAIYAQQICADDATIERVIAEWLGDEWSEVTDE